MSSEEMSSFFYGSTMESVHGDLTDIVRGSAGSCSFMPVTDDGPCADPIANNLQELSAKEASPVTLKPIRRAPAAAPTVSAPRAPGVKRRKGQAKRVICIPAPASDQESSRTGGVVVPADLWAWRKYGQKPIKGSPYPRGYYRCSSSKGCSARKQVERSHSDPNMLVITYASEHNHPWPVHRNSLAGSTRSQPSKSSHNTSKNSNASHAQLSPSCSKQEPDDMSLSSSPTLELANKEKSLELARVFDHSYEPIMLETKDMGFFDELGGLEPDPMSFFFSSRVEGANKGLDPLSYFDWDGN